MLNENRNKYLRTNGLNQLLTNIWLFSSVVAILILHKTPFQWMDRSVLHFQNAHTNSMNVANL